MTNKHQQQIERMDLFMVYVLVITTAFCAIAFLFCLLQFVWAGAMAFGVATVCGCFLIDDIDR